MIILSDTEENPLVSICLLTYNHENFIKIAIDSILNQNVGFLCELIIVEDKSTDRTPVILKEYAEKYPIKLTLHEKNMGPFRSWIELISKSKGKYLAYIEGDDYWTDEFKLQKQVDFLEANEDFSMCFHDVKILTKEGLIENHIQYVKDIYDIYDIAEDNIIHTVTALMRNVSVNEFPKYMHNTIQDYPLFMLLAKKGKIRFLSDVMAVYRVHDLGIWSGSGIEKRFKVKVNLYKKFLKDDFDNCVKVIIKQKLCSMYVVLIKRGYLKYFFNLFALDPPSATKLLLVKLKNKRS